MRRAICLTLFFFYSMSLFSQNKRPNIFLDCQMRCDFVYLKQEITFVNYMNNRLEADIYILATRQRTGAGGTEVQLIYTGENQFQGIQDTLIYLIEPNTTDAIERDLLVNTLKKGLLQFLVRTPLLDQLEYTIKDDGLEDVTDANERDPWNYWVFNIGGNFWMNAEESFRSIDLTGRVNISRITDKEKFRFSSRYNYETTKFSLTDGEEFTSIRRQYSTYLEYVFSLNPHWSLGGVSRAGSSTFGNTDFSMYVKPAIEYNIFPYTDASTRRFSFRYAIGPEYFNYTDTTVYEKLRETVIRHSLDVEYEQTQKWGNIEIDFGVSQYMHDLKLLSTFINPDIELIVFKGLRLDFGGYVSFVGDRINIAKSDISDEDILLQIKQLDTDFTYFIYTGINYRFGSKFNNFVNQRF